MMINEVEAKYNITVLYITKSGSNLYGTATPTSDTDYKGIFLPNKADRILSIDKDHISLDTNKTKHANSVDDVDFTLDSIHKFFKLLAKGETGAIDILFSMWVNPETLFTKWCKDNYKSLITSNPHAFIGYAISQSKRYNIRGERYNELVRFNQYLNNPVFPKDCKLSVIFNAMSYHLNNRYKHIQITRGPGSKREGYQEEMDYIEVLGKKFVPTVTIGYLQERLKQMEDQFGDRARKASDNVDWKALSHALRVVLEVKELLTDSFITFPLKDAQYLREIKQGDWDIDTIIDHLEREIANIDILLETTSLPKKPDKELVDKYLLSLYKETK